MEKKCPKCGVVKPLDGFHKNKSRSDDHSHYCKSCACARVQRYQHTERGRTLQRAAAGRYRKTEKGRAAFKRHRSQFPAKANARLSVSHAVASGMLIRPDRCSECEAIGPVQAHHPDYDKPLEVVWLCLTCHYRSHYHLTGV